MAPPRLSSDRQTRSSIQPTGHGGCSTRGLPHALHKLEQALNATPTDWYAQRRIALRAGSGHRKLHQTQYQLIGESRTTCVITFDAYSGKRVPSGVGTWTILAAPPDSAPDGFRGQQPDHPERTGYDMALRATTRSPSI